MDLYTIESHEKAFILILLVIIGAGLYLLSDTASPGIEPVAGCGDRICDVDESCSICPGDCGACIVSNDTSDTGVDPFITSVSEALPETKCEATEGESYLKALETSNIFFCACITDEAMRENCKEVVAGKNNYEEAVQNFDLSLCDEVTNPFGQESCKKIVTEGLSIYMEDSPLQFIALYLEVENYEDALPLLQDRLEEDPYDFIALTVLAQIYADYSWNQPEYYQQSLDLIDKALEGNSNNPLLYKIQGYAHEASGDVFASLKSYEKAVEIDSGYLPGYIGIGHAYRVEGALFSALDAFEKAKALDTEFMYSAIYMNLCSLQSSNFDYILDAVENCEIVTQLETSSDDQKAMAYGVLGSIHLDFGTIDEASYSYEQALIYNPGDEHIYVLLAILKNYEGDFILAQEYAEKAIELNPAKSLAYIHLADSLYAQGKLDLAIEKVLISLDTIDSDSTMLFAEKESNKNFAYRMLEVMYGDKGDAINEQKYADLLNA